MIDRDYLSFFEQPRLFDASTVRKKLNELAANGLLKTEKHGKTLFYSRSDNLSFDNTDVLHFFSEVAPCGVVGSFLLDRIDDKKDILSFKHHYITSALDSEIVFSLLEAMNNKQEIEISKITRKGESRCLRIIPLRIFISAANGRQYLMAYRRAKRRIVSFRTDYILSVKQVGKEDDFDILRKKLNGMQPYMWGVSTQGRGERRETVEFTVNFRDDEKHIYDRLMREKRCGTVTLLDDNNAQFDADVFDPQEIIPWARSFICRITFFDCSEKYIARRFYGDIRKMYRLYFDEEVGEADDAVQ